MSVCACARVKQKAKKTYFPAKNNCIFQKTCEILVVCDLWTVGMSAELKSFISSSFCRRRFLPNLKADLLSVPRQLDVVDGSRTVVLKIHSWADGAVDKISWSVSVTCLRQAGHELCEVKGRLKEPLCWRKVRGEKSVSRLRASSYACGESPARSCNVTWPYFDKHDYLLLPLTLRALSLSWVRFPRIGSEQRHQCFTGDEWSLL